MEVECGESHRPSDGSNALSASDSFGWKTLNTSSFVSNETILENDFSAISPPTIGNKEIKDMTDLWANIFKENPRVGATKLFTVIINHFDIVVHPNDFSNFDPVLIFTKLVKKLIIMKKNGSLCSPDTLKKSINLTKTLQLVASIFQHHSDLFINNSINECYFTFITSVLIKISQSEFIGPRFLATSFGLKIITGILQFNNLELVLKKLNLLLKEFFTKRFQDTAFVIRETVLLELDVWIKIDFHYIFNDYWTYIYEALSDQSSSVQNLALKMSKYVINLPYDHPKVKFFVKKIVTVLAYLLLSKKEETVLSAFDLYSIIPRIDEEDEFEQCMSKIESIALELMFSEKSNVAKCAGKYFVEKIINVKPHESEQIKSILMILKNIPPQLLRAVATSYYIDAIFEFCPVLTNFELMSKILNSDNFIEDEDKCNLIILLSYVVQRSVTGLRFKHEVAHIGDCDDEIEVHKNIYEKKQFTTYLTLHIINQLKQCKDDSRAFWLWCLVQYFDFELLQDKMILPTLFECVSTFYTLCDSPTILEMVSRSAFIMISNLKNDEKYRCLRTIKDIATFNIGVLKDGVENSPENVPSFQIQKNSLIKIWSLAKYNNIPDDLEPLKYLSNYIPNFSTTQANVVVSAFALNAYMEILRNQLLKIPNEGTVEITFINFIGALFNILNILDRQFLDLCKTAFLVVDKLLRIKFKTNGTKFTFDKEKNTKLTNFIFDICSNYEHENDVNSSKLLEVYLQLVQDGFIEVNHLMTPLQFVKKKFIECALRPVFDFFCNKDTGNMLSNTIELFMVYLFENTIFGKPGFENSKVEDVNNVASIISRLLNQCTDKTGKRLVSTRIHQKGIQYALNSEHSTTINMLNDSQLFKIFFWVLASMCDILVPYDAQKLFDYILNKPVIQECITAGNKYVIEYAYKLEKLCENLKS